jgi:cell division protein FtsB
MTAMLADVASMRGGPRWPRRGRKPLTVLCGFLAVAVVVTELAGDRGIVEFLRIRDEHGRVQAGVDRARIRNARLQEAVRRMREDPAAIEDAARRDLGLIRPGETLFIIRDVPGER